MNDQEKVKQQLIALVQAAMEGDEEAQKQIQQVMNAAKNGDKQAQQVATLIQEIMKQLQNSQAQSAALGSKLNYIHRLRTGVNLGDEVVFERKGGKVCKKVCKKTNCKPKGKKLADGGNVPKYITYFSDGGYVGKYQKPWGSLMPVNPGAGPIGGIYIPRRKAPIDDSGYIGDIYAPIEEVDTVYIEKPAPIKKYPKKSNPIKPSPIDDGGYIGDTDLPIVGNVDPDTIKINKPVIVDTIGVATPIEIDRETGLTKVVDGEGDIYIINIKKNRKSPIQIKSGNIY